MGESSDSNETSSTSPSVTAKTLKRQTQIANDFSDDTVVKDKSQINFTQGDNPDKFKFYPDNPESHRHKYKWSMKEPSKFYDPCEESRMASMHCLWRNQDDKYACQEFFDAYRECKKDFFAKKKKDRLEGKHGWGFWD
ncbi:Cytochrome c oxidase-assembly factor COX23 mitochondrial [Spathaspora sp. JA1]|nr:Cytochrome c oxidase-assembly factor COX23 mitochondrial [Spathaspora sp. JA1]